MAGQKQEAQRYAAYIFQEKEFSPQITQIPQMIDVICGICEICG